jgi:hypothetical protein
VKPLLAHRHALKSLAQILRCTLERRAPNPSEIRVLEFKEEFRRSAIWSVSANIDINWPIFMRRGSKERFHADCE